ncbi:cation diffusion facilitator family metal ion transporter [Aspergillus campestris IBT 28561]|uniref:Cation diffusion facilitator family metal ion transporter n=1 Tax=Aspergillus campestris (strain IBT 28561) TaxID=1392248 RepID=A0A2I1D6X9_ASPC2|nr:cation diffusion facilitator family metal ion transporter [Aspergillus campestris IBT 28561]PKY05613.1 cation diffusion facilitator family metal ion transporter [Aspergillus campestris IBT 28561]
MAFKVSRSQRLSAVIVIASLFFISEIAVGFYTHSLALVADAFHYLSDLVGFVVALVAVRVSESGESPDSLSFGWQRAQLLGAFFNGVLLLGLGISIFLQSIERFVTPSRVENPKLMLIMGCIGLGLNILSVTFLHEHHHHGHDHDHSHSHKHVPALEDPITAVESGCGGERKTCEHHDHEHQDHATRPAPGGHDLAMMGVLLHVIGDAANNLGVIIAALVIWLARYEGRYYADPGTSMGIAIMIILSSYPLVRRSGLILLESSPDEIDPREVKGTLEKIPGVLSTHDLHIWQLNQQKTLASVHIVVSEPSMGQFQEMTKVIRKCFHAYGVHSVTLQPEIAPVIGFEVKEMTGGTICREKCQMMCGTTCEELMCCGPD